MPREISFFFVDIESCLLYKSDAADDLQFLDIGSGRILRKKKTTQPHT